MKDLNKRLHNVSLDVLLHETTDEEFQEYMTEMREMIKEAEQRNKRNNENSN